MVSHQHSGALDCLQHLAGRPVLLLSNAPRRAESVRRTLRRLGIADALYTHILTSGEATWQALKDSNDPWFASLGSRVYLWARRATAAFWTGSGSNQLPNPITRISSSIRVLMA